MEGGVNLHGVGLHQGTGGGIVALALDALYLGKEFAEVGAQGGVVVDADVGLVLALDEFHGGRLAGYGALGALHLLAVGAGQYPVGDEGAVAHVGLLNVVAGLDAHELGDEAVLHIGVELCLVGLHIGCEAEFAELGVGHVVEAEEVGAGLLNGGAVGLQRVGVGAGEEFAGAVAEAFVEVGVEVVGEVAVLADEGEGGVVDGELLTHTAAGSCLGIGGGEVADGDALGAEVAAHPVGVGQVDADGGAGVEVAGENGGGDDLGADALALCFLEAGVNGGVVLKPLGVGGEFLRAGRGGEVLEVDNALPRGLHAEGVAVGLGEAVDEIYGGGGVLEPEDVEGVKGAEVARAVVFDEFADDALLLGRVGEGQCFLQPIYYAGEGSVVEAAYAIDLLIDEAPLVAHEAGVEAHHYGARVGEGLALGVELLGLGLRDAGGVVVAGGGEDEVLAVALVGAHLHDAVVEDDGEDFLVEGGAYALEGVTQPYLGEVGVELLAAVVVVDAGGEPQALEIHLEGEEVLVLAVAPVVGVDFLEGVADAEVVASVLVEKDVASGEGGFLEVIDEGLLAQGELVEAGHLIAEHLDVGKLLVGVLEVVGSLAGCEG